MSNTAVELTKLFYELNYFNDVSKDDIIKTYLYFNKLLMEKIGEQFEEIMKEKGVEIDD